MLGAAKPRKNEQIKIKEQLIFEGPYNKYQIIVNVKDTTVKLTFEESKKPTTKTDKTTTTSSASTSTPKDDSNTNPFLTDNPFNEGMDSSNNQNQQIEVENLGFPSYDYNKMEKDVKVNWYMNERFDQELFNLFVKFYFGYEIQNIKRDKQLVFVLNEELEIETIYRKNLYEKFSYYQNLFKLYCFGSFDDQTLIPVYQVDVYQIENNIYDFKDLFNNIELSDEIVCVQYQENVKCPLYWSLKTLTIYPNFGQSGFSIVFKKDGLVQIQIIQDKYFYVFTLLTTPINDSKKEQLPKKEIIKIVPFQITIKSHINTYYEVQQQFQYEHSQFMSNFSEHFEVQKLSNTNFTIEFLNDLTVFIYTRYSTLFFSTIFNDLNVIRQYFKICQNCGNFEETQAITDLSTLQIVSPLEFGNTNISNFEHQLESMKKRPSIIPNPNLKQFLIKSITNNNTNNTNETKKDEQEIVDIQNEMALMGYEIDKFKFFCNSSFPYLNFTKYDVEYQEDNMFYPLYYYKCQQVPIKYTVQNIYRLYDIYRHFKLNSTFEKRLYQKIHGLIQQKPNLFMRYETIIPGTYTILPQELYKIFPNTTFLLKLVPSSDEKITYDEYTNDKIINEPWDNEWLKSVCEGNQISISNAVFYNIELNQYFVYVFQESYEYIILIYHQQFFTLIQQQNTGDKIQLGRGRVNGASTPDDEQQEQDHYELYKIDFVFDKSLNTYVEAHEFNNEYIQTQYLKQDIIISKENVIYDIIPQKSKINEPYTQKSTYDQIYMIDSKKEVIGYKQYNVYIYYDKSTKLNYNMSYVLSNKPSKKDPIQEIEHEEIPLSISEIAAIIIINNKSILLSILSELLQKQNKFSSSTIDNIYKKLYLKITKKQELQLYNTKVNYLTTGITEKQAKEGIRYILDMIPNSENLLRSYIINYIIEDQLYFNPSHETIKQLSQYIQLQNLLKYRILIQE